MDTTAREGSPVNGSKRSIVLTALRLLVGLLLAGYFFLWIMIPTDTYWYHWLPYLREKTSSTYFGNQGTSILLYTFPILFISVIGCIFLHLAKNKHDIMRGVSYSRLAAWQRPVLVKGPLGVVSGTELAFFLMFLALLIWYFSISTSNSIKRVKGMNMMSMGVDMNMNMGQMKLMIISHRFGLVGNICLVFLFFPVSRGSSVLPLFGLRSESSIKYHMWLGHIAMLLLTLHGIGYIIFWAITNEMAEILKWAKVGISNVAGELSLLFGLIMWATTFSRIRRKMFELFFYAHQLYIFFMIFFVLHLSISFFSYALPGFYLFLLDRYLRFLQSRRHVKLVSARILPCETVELNFLKSAELNYTMMSSIFINIPQISSLQWHPFTVSSSSNMESDKLSVIIKKEGSWSHKLFQILNSPTNPERLDICVEGPYGPASVDLLRYDSLVMVSGGSGITPFISIVRELIHHSTIPGASTPSVLLICAFKTSSDLTMLDLLLPISGNISDLSKLQLRVEAFVTREKSSDPNVQKLIQTIWFRPSASDVPIAPILGPNGWLWLAAVICTSFISYLILLGILGGYYIYPIDHNTNQVYPYASKALLNLLFICITIVATASGAVLWHKRRITVDAKQIQIVDTPTPSSSPSRWFCSDDRELESLPHQSIMQATNLTLGRRPNLKKMLLECEGKDVGVVASGPREMRHEVANICSSGLAPNLHFDALSFSW